MAGGRKEVDDDGEGPARLSPKQRLRELFSAQLNDMMGAKRLNIADLERATGVAKASLSTYALGRNLPSRKNHLTLASFFNVPMERFFEPLQGEGAAFVKSRTDVLKLHIKTDDPSLSRLLVDMQVPTELGAQIAGMLSKLNATN